MLNRVMLIGNVGFISNVSETKNGMKMLNFSLATQQYYIDKKTNEKKTITDWHNIITFNNKIIDFLSKLYVGNKVYVEGRIQYSEYTDKNNIKQKAVNILLDKIELLNNNKKENGISNQDKKNYSNDDDIEVNTQIANSSDEMPKEYYEINENDEIPF